MSQSAGILALNPADYSIAGNLGKADVGFTVTPDGTVWAVNGNYLLSINPQDLSVDTVTMPFSCYGAWGAWNAGMLAASASENAVFVGKNNSWGAGGQEIYKYRVGVSNSFVSPFVTIDAGTELIGAGFSVNPTNNTLVVTSVKSGYGDNYKQNTLGIYDANTGALQKKVPYEGFFFPAMPAVNR